MDENIPLKHIHFKRSLPTLTCLKLKEYLIDKNLLHDNPHCEGVWKFETNILNDHYITIGIICKEQYYYLVYIAVTEFFMKNNLII